MNEVNINTSEQALGVKNSWRGQMELLQGRLGLLSGKDRVLMTMYIVNGNSFRQIAHLRGVSEASVARRIHQLTERLIDGEFLMCVRNRDKLSRRQMSVARDYFLTGESIKGIAGKRGISMYAVRKELVGIRNLIGKKSTSRTAVDLLSDMHDIRGTNNGDIQHFKKDYVAGDNDRPGHRRLPDVRPDR